MLRLLREDSAIFWRVDFDLERQRCLLDVVSVSGWCREREREMGEAGSSTFSQLVLCYRIISDGCTDTSPRQSDDDEITCWRNFAKTAKHTPASPVLCHLDVIYLPTESSRSYLVSSSHTGRAHKKLCYCRLTVRRDVSVKILPTAAQQCRNHF